MASFLQSAGVALLAAFVAAGWHVLARNEKPEPQELAVGFDLVVSAIVLETGFMPGSQGTQLVLRWIGVTVLLLMLQAMAVLTRMFGYKKSDELFRRHLTAKGHVRKYENLKRLTGAAALVTTGVGGAILCVFWWLNMNIGWVNAAWREVLR